MTVISHKIRIYPNKTQEEILKKSCGVSRFVYNWGLNYWDNEYKNGNKPNYYIIKKYFNSIKEKDYPFVCEVSKCCAEYALSDLNTAFTNFFKKKSKYPTFHKKGKRDSFSLSNDQIKLIDKKYLRIPKLNKPLKLSEELRFNGKIMRVTISKTANKWYASISVDTNIKRLSTSENVIGIDLGVKEMATCSNGLQFGNPKWIKKIEKRLKRNQRKLVKQKKSSKRRERTKIRIQKLFDRLSSQRKDYLHKMTTYLIKTNDVICLENLNTNGMLKNHKLAKAISNVSFFEIRRQLEYKANMYGRKILYVDRFFPSSKSCSNCGCTKENLTLKDRIFKCEDCGFELDRDLNASKNILRQAMSEVKHLENQYKIDYTDILTLTKIYSINQLDSLNGESKLVK